MTVTAAMVKELRERTGVGMMECKKALQEAGGDMEAAIVEMRKRGQAKAAKRAGKTAAEGKASVALSDDGKTGAITEVNSETDFVAIDGNFTGFAAAVTQCALDAKAGDCEAIKSLACGDKTVEERRQELVAKLGENIQLRRAAVLQAEGVVGAYTHGNRIAVLVALDKPEAELAKEIAMHVAASNPQAISEEDLDPALIAKEKEIFIAQAKESGKPDNIIEKMVDGRIAKYLKEVCLNGQPFIKNPDETIAKLLEKHGAKVTAFVRYEVGEGIEKEVVDFAEEVKAQVQGS